MLTYNNTKVSSEVVGTAANVFQAHLKSAGTLSYDELIAEVAKRQKDTTASVRATLDTAGEVVKENLQDGNRCTYEGVCRFELTVEGSFENADEAWDPTKHRVNVAVIAYDSLKSALAEVTPTNELSVADVRVIGLQDAVTFEQDVYTKGNNLLVQGVGLYIKTGTGALTDEMCGVIAEDGTVIPFTITGSTSTTLDCNCSAATLVAGEYTFFVASRGANSGNNEYTLVRATRPLTVKVAA